MSDIELHYEAIELKYRLHNDTLTPEERQETVDRWKYCELHKYDDRKNIPVDWCERIFFWGLPVVLVAGMLAAGSSYNFGVGLGLAFIWFFAVGFVWGLIEIIKNFQ